jgi:hypothetical protein
VWSSADLHNVAWFSTVEAKTTMRVFTRLVQSRSIGWGAGGTVAVEGLEKEKGVVVVEVMTGGG